VSIYVNTNVGYFETNHRNRLIFTHIKIKINKMFNLRVWIIIAVLMSNSVDTDLKIILLGHKNNYVIKDNKSCSHNKQLERNHFDNKIKV